MKKLLLFFALFIFSFFCHSQSNIWTGDANTSDWNNPANWSLGTVPGPTTSVSIKILSNKPYPVLTNNVEIDYLDMYNKGAGGSLYLGNYELKTGTVWVAASNIYSNGGTIRTSMVRLCGGMNFYGNLTLYTDNGVIGGYGANTFHGDLTVYAKPHVPAGSTTSECWPCGGLMFSYSSGDTFKGNFKLIKRYAASVGNVSYIGFGVYPVNIVFEKKATFIDSSSIGLSLGFTQWGGTVTFKDSTFFSLNSSYIALKGNMEFQKPVTFRQSGGNIELAAWGDHSNSDAPRQTLVNFRKDVLIDKSGGTLSLGNWTQQSGGFLYHSSTIDTSGTIKLTGQGFTGGVLNLYNTTIHSPYTQILASTHPSSLSTGTKISFSHSEVNGEIRVKADDLYSFGTTFSGRATIQKDGYAASPNSAGGNTFKKTVELINSAGYDWNFGNENPDIFKDTVLIALSGSGQHQIVGSNRGALFKVAMVNGNRFEGPVRIETSTAHSGDIQIGNYGSAEILASVDIANFKSGNLTFFNSKFRGKNLSRNLTTTSPGVRLLFKNNCLFEGPVSFKVPHFGSDYTNFMKPVVIWKTEAGDDSSIGGNVFHERVQFKNTASTGKVFLLSGEDKLIDKVLPQ